MFSGIMVTECCDVCHSTTRLLKNMNMPGSSGGESPAHNHATPVASRARIPPSRRLCLGLLDDKTKAASFGDKENGSPRKDLKTHQAPSVFSSPAKFISPSKYAVARKASNPNLRFRLPLEEQDQNSQDSGCETAPIDKDETAEGFRFTEPLGTAPRRMQIEQSPRKDFIFSPRKSVRTPLFHSLSSGSTGSESIDDGFLELYECEKMDEDAQLPSGMSSLIGGPLKEFKRSPLKETSNNSPFLIGTSIRNENNQKHSEYNRYIGRSLSSSSCSARKVRSCLFSSPASSVSDSPCSIDGLSPACDNVRAVKRPEPPCGSISPMETKRHKLNSVISIKENEVMPDLTAKGTLLNYGFERHSVKLQRSFSDTEATIKRALQKASVQPDLIGDFSKPFILPLMNGRHQDLKSISPETLAALLNGEYQNSVDSFTIVDCRYPYEYNGGHIRGARNIYTKDEIWKEFVDIKDCPNSNSSLFSSTEINETSEIEKRRILIFHCEFSSERGPNMTRFLRNCDRTRNKDIYPALNYPEIYLLDGGYKNFYESHKDLCEPQAYQPMHDPKFESDLRLFRAKTKSWSGDTKSRQTLRSSLKRLGL